MQQCVWWSCILCHYGKLNKFWLIYVNMCKGEGCKCDSCWLSLFVCWASLDPSYCWINENTWPLHVLLPSPLKPRYKSLVAEFWRYCTQTLSRFQSSSHPRAIERKREEKRESESPILCDSSEVHIEITSFTGSLYLVALASSGFYYLAVLV